MKKVPARIEMSDHLTLYRYINTQNETRKYCGWLELVLDWTTRYWNKLINILSTVIMQIMFEHFEAVEGHKELWYGTDLSKFHTLIYNWNNTIDAQLTNPTF